MNRPVDHLILTVPLSTAQLEKQGTINNELAVVISSIALACKQIASLVNRAGISNLTGVAGAQNVQVQLVAWWMDKENEIILSSTAACLLWVHEALTCITQGEDQKKLDVVSNEVFKNCLSTSGRTVREICLKGIWQCLTS